MPLFKNLYLSDRVFYVLGSVIFLFFLSFLFNPVFYAALVLLGLFLVVTGIDIVLLFKNKHISISRETVSVFSLGDLNKVGLILKNNSDRPFTIKIIDEIPYQLNDRDFSIEVPIGKLKNEAVTYYLSPKVRGEYRFGDLHVFIRTKLGLAVKRETTQAVKSVAVYPSIILMKQQELAVLKHPSFMQGDNKNRKLGRSYEFDQIKNYVDGDDTRNINWKATSTLNKLMVNHYEDERSQQVYSIIDKSRIMKMPFNGLTLVDYAINSTLAFSNIVLKKSDKAGLITFSQKVDSTLKAERGGHHLKKIMYSLYKEKYDYSEANYEALYSSIRKTINNRSLIFLYTNFDSIYALDRNIKTLRMIHKYHALIVVFFENTELDAYAKLPATSVLDIYQKTMAKKNALEKIQIIKELRAHGIPAIKCAPEQLSAKTINKYLELKSSGFI
jgi:uncharacterized protein (DUF58 family)